MKICVPIIGPTIDDALKDIATAEEVKADILELRIDMMQTIELKKLINASKIPKIVTNMPESEGGKFTGTEKERIGYLQQAIDMGVEYVSNELASYHEFDRSKVTTILSHHNFKETPDNLKEIYNEIAEKNPDIIKIATKANSYGDCLRMLNLVAESDRLMIGLGMGKEGLPTRVIGTGYLTFAALNKEKVSGPGQPTVKELREAWRILQVY